MAENYIVYVPKKNYSDWAFTEFVEADVAKAKLVLTINTFIRSHKGRENYYGSLKAGERVLQERLIYYEVSLVLN